MFRAYLGPLWGGTTVCIQYLVLFRWLFRWLSVVLVGLESGGTTVCIQQLVLIILFVNDCLLFWLNNPTRTTDSHLKRIVSTSCCIHTVVPPDDGPRYARWAYIRPMGLDTPETCRGWRNMLRISCVSSWFFCTQIVIQFVPLSSRRFFLFICNNT